MKRHESILNKIQKIKSKSSNDPVSLHKGKYSLESTYVMRLCDADDLLAEMAKYLGQVAGSYSFGGEYNKICEILEKLNEYHKKVYNSTHNGRDWGDFENKDLKQAVEKYTGSIFGRCFEEILRMQQGE